MEVSAAKARSAPAIVDPPAGEHVPYGVGGGSGCAQIRVGALIPAGCGCRINFVCG